MLFNTIMKGLESEMKRAEAAKEAAENFKTLINNAIKTDRENGSSRSQEFYDQISHFSYDLYECISKFLERINDKYAVENILDYKEEMEEIRLADYDSGNHDYERLSKAKVACKETVNQAIDDVYENFKAVKEDIINKYDDFWDDVDADIQEFIKEFQDSYEDYVSLDCEDEDTTEHANTWKAGLTDEETLTGRYNDLHIRETYTSLMEELFDKPAADLLKVQKYYAMCEYDEDDGDYSYEMDSAIECMNQDIVNLYENACDHFAKSMAELYQSALYKFTSSLQNSLIRMVQTTV